MLELVPGFPAMKLFIDGPNVKKCGGTGPRFPLCNYLLMVPNNVADLGCLFRMPDAKFSIPDHGSALKNLRILIPFLSSRKYDPGCSSRV